MSPKLFEPIQELIQQFKPTVAKEFYPRDVERIKVDIIASKIASFYEKIRNAIDYQEEHLLRRNAIRRMLKRMIIVEGKKEKMGKPLLFEIIRARYVENNKLPETKIDEIDRILNKYIYLIQNLPNGTKEKRETVNWLISIASCEVEEKLVPYEQDEALVKTMYQTITPDIVFLDKKIQEDEKKILIYLAIHHSLIKSDQSLLRYRLLELYYPDWHDPDQDTIESVRRNIKSLKDYTEEQINDPGVDSLMRLLKEDSVYFLILKDVIAKDPNTAMSRITDPAVLEQEIIGACDTRYGKIKTKLRRSVRRSVIYIFLTKMLLGIILELPYDMITLGHVNYLPLGINIIFHPALLFLTTAPTRIPAEKNTKKIIAGIKSIIHNQEQEKIIFKPKKSKRLMLSIAYLAMFVISFGLIIYVLRKLNFNLPGIILFVLFLSIISFFAIRIKRGAKELIVLGRKEGVVPFLIDFLTVPIVRAGRWISLKSAKINIFMFILDFIIEAPFKILVDAFEQLVSFVREKKEEVY